MPGLIEDYALIGDTQTAALVCRDGSIDWLCFPRFDSGACFAALLGNEDNGRWLLAPAGAGNATRRRYRGDTLVLETEWETAQGSVRVIDFMPHRGEAPDVVRIVEGVSGSVPMHCDLRLRFDYGKVVPWVRRMGDQLAAVAGPDAIWLRSPIELHADGFAHRAEFTVRAGDRIPFVFTWHPSHLPMPTPVDAEHALVETEELWSEWLESCDYEGPWRDAVVRSLITLKSLTYSPTGGIVAAPTTSLPEDLGGERNWDYRYCWLRDATVTLEALLRSGFTHEAREWREWLLRAIAGSPQDLQIMYGVAGERRIMEWEVPWLSGYENSSPVRVGNAAAGQVQHDIYGEVVNALHLGLLAGVEPDDYAWSLQRGLMNHLESNWDRPDMGLWEIRGGTRHFVHSKVMAWVAADRMVRMVQELGHTGPVRRWEALRDDIHREVCEKGFDAERNTFTQSYGNPELDAALLLIPRVGFLPNNDERVIGTINAIQRDLSVDGLIMRYETRASGNVDGLSGQEGAFLACSFWLADGLHYIGRESEAHELFERLLSLRNDVGLLSEEYDPRHERLVGNMPQAFSHVPLVRTAHNLVGRDRVRQTRTSYL